MSRHGEGPVSTARALSADDDGQAMFCRLQLRDSIFAERIDELRAKTGRG
jgi:hypothetical protein